MRNFKLLFLALIPLTISACSTNPATGKQQFTALMSPQQEVQVGASEHQKIVKQYGLVKDQALNNYVNEIGRKVTADTERPDVKYTFYVLDSPIVNAFALPGGYIYVSRGLLALANNEAELASVLGHEAAHITARHSAERYSRGVVTSLGASVLSAAIGSSGASQALGLGANLYLSSYSRDQENEADTLGLRYMTRGGYHPEAVPSFLYSLERQSELDAKLAGRGKSAGHNYFSTHPATADRVHKTRGESKAYAQGGVKNPDRHLKAINGMIYGDSAAQGFARGNEFYHPGLGFTFSVPEGFRINNQPSQVVASARNGAVVLFDMAGNKQGLHPYDYLTGVWLKDTKLTGSEKMAVHGQPAATASFTGTIKGQPMTIRVVAIKWKQSFVRFQIAIPQNAPATQVEALKGSTYSFRAMTGKEKASVKPHLLKLYTARKGDTVASIARRQPFDQLQEERFRVLNGLQPGEGLVAGKAYKIVSE